MRNRLMLGLVLLGVTGCSEYIPTVAFDRIDVSNIDWQHIDSDFVFKVNNPDPVDITLARFDYTLAFDGVEFVSGDDPDGLVLAASGGSELVLPVSLEFANLYELVQASRGQDTIPFSLSGHFGFDTPAGTVDLPYDAEGDFPALRTPTFTFSKVRVDELGLSSATIAVDLAVDNALGSTLYFDNFDYQLNIEGTKVASGLVDSLGGADGASTTTLTLPVEVSYFGVGSAVYEALSGDKVKLGLAASTDVETPFGTIPLTLDESGTVKVVQ